MNCVCKTETIEINETMRNLSGYSSGSASSADELFCPSYNSCCESLQQEMGFWLEGVVQTTFAVGGILANTISSLILASKGMQSSSLHLKIRLLFPLEFYLILGLHQDLLQGFIYQRPNGLKWAWKKIQGRGWTSPIFILYVKKNHPLMPKLLAAFHLY